MQLAVDATVGLDGALYTPPAAIEAATVLIKRPTAIPKAPISLTCTALISSSHR